MPCDRIVFLGDLANFGPYPSECVDILSEYDPIRIMGNHDKYIVSDNPSHKWDAWSKRQLSLSQQEWIRGFYASFILDGHILLVHNGIDVKFDILPETSDEDIKKEFEALLTPDIDQVWFGHYHYQIDRVIDGVEYHCIRPVGQHRDKDTRTGYSVYEDGVLTHHRVEYELSETVQGVKNLEVFKNREEKERFIAFLESADIKKF